MFADQPGLIFLYAQFAFALWANQKIEKLFIPPIDKRAQFLEGSPDETASSLVTIFKEKGIV